MPALIIIPSPLPNPDGDISQILRRSSGPASNRGRSAATLDQNILEAWSQGLLFGSIVMLIMFTVSNMRRHILLHKLILLELVLILGHGTFIFCHDPTYGWYLSATAVLLYQTWSLHSVIQWLKNRPFLPRWGSAVYIATIALAYPYWMAETVLNFYWFNSLGNDAFKYTRPYETFFRDPWWIFTTCNLIYVIKRQYSLDITTLIKASPRFGVLLFCMLVAFCFAITDLTVSLKEIGGVDGINPYWKLSTVFKCASDTLFLDDFKRVLDGLAAVAVERTVGAEAADLHREAITCRGIPRSPRDGGFSLMPGAPPMSTVVTTRSDDTVLGSGAGGMKKGRRGSGRRKKKVGVVGGLFRSKKHAEGTPGGGGLGRLDERILRRDYTLGEGEEAPMQEAGGSDGSKLRRIPTRRSSKVSGIGSDRTVDWFDIFREENVVLEGDEREAEEKKKESQSSADVEKAIKKAEKSEEGSDSEEVEFVDAGGLAN